MRNLEVVNLKYISSTPWFDDKTYIDMAAQSLKTFKNLAVIRREYGDFQPARLNNFVVGGIWNLDIFGQLGVRTMDHYGVPPSEDLKDWLKRTKERMTVHDRDQFHQYLEKLGFKGSSGFAFGGSGVLPGEHEVCAVCGNGWEPHNSDDCFRKGRPDPVYIAAGLAKSFIGKTIDEIDEAELKRDGTPMRLDRINPFKNPKYIDLTMKDDYGQVRPVNAEGWLSTHYSDEGKPYHIDPKKYKMQEGDEPIFECQRVAHAACITKALSEDIAEEFTKAFKKAGIDITGVIPITNQYVKSMHGGSWYLFTTEKSIYRLGWRRHVISLIEMQTEQNYNHLVFDKKSEDMHFNTYEELSKYLKEKEES